MSFLLPVQYGFPRLSLGDFLALAVLLAAILGFGSKGLLWDRPNPLTRQLYERRQETFLGRTRKVQRESRHLGRRVKQDNLQAVILWGSQTGTAEGLAQTLGRTLRSHLGIQVGVLDLSHIIPHTLASVSTETPLIFLLSTYGEGDPTDNTIAFHRWILSSRTTANLSNIRYAAFGLGNSTYLYFNRAVKSVVQQLDSREAVRIASLGQGDAADGSTEDSFFSWQDELLNVLKKHLCISNRQAASFQPAMRFLPASLDERTWTGKPQDLQLSHRASPPYDLGVTDQGILNPSSSWPCLYFQIDISEHPQLKYNTGDHLLIWPSNPQQEVNRLVRLLDCDPDQVWKILPISESCNSRIPPSPVSLGVLLRCYLAITSPVSRQMLQSLVQATPNTEEALRDGVSEIESRTDQWNRVRDSRWTLGEVMERVQAATGGDWHSLPLSWLVENIPPLQPRAYSIASSAVIHPRLLSIAVALPQETPSWRSGLVTDRLRNAPASIVGQLRRSKFKLPTNASADFIMVAAGSGIAPFRAFIQERARLHTIGRPIGRMTLFFGCRTANDYLYKDDLESAQRQLESLFHIHVVFSRDPPQLYVQDAITEHADMIVKHLREEGNFFYICGSRSMGRGVAEVVGDSLAKAGNGDKEQVTRFMSTMKKRGQWQEDVW
ncbi:hypothetical protein N7462_003040 [Penicillium macrosclerotiorum]|uniref:uncharacterized protein n=1 Tax=Penicillium macrosclerotiorum TaxID=303699 RepID=UPI002547C798|nr:uncharacterized protein N7462_003040 [Penicillium macrosclerotiorum]KAJ5688648.1 hypothetical protein N7462_003040 [Penicillium macrosclerotiorum]